MHNRLMINRGPVLFGVGYLVLAGLFLAVSADNPAEVMGFPSSPIARIGFVAVFGVPLALWLGYAMSRMEFDAHGARWMVVLVMALLLGAIALAAAILPVDVFSCATLRGRLDALPPECSTTPAMRWVVFGETSVVWMVFGGYWYGMTRWQARRERRREQRTVRAASSA